MIRRAALLLLVIATAYALHRVVIVPIRCARAATNFRSLDGCGCVTAREAHIDFIRGGMAARRGDHLAAIDDFNRALQVEPRPEIYFALGMSELAVFERKGALSHLTTACKFDPRRLADIPYGDVRAEVERRIRADYGERWIR